MPERLLYDEAMMFSSSRLKIPDAELKQGQVEKITIQTKVGTVVRPWGIEGGFAVVYKFRAKSGKMRALRCFRVPMATDTQFRYERIGPYFATQAQDITVHFKYHNNGITVKEQGKAQGHIYPVIEMDWIDGQTLLEKVDELCKNRDRATLKNLSEQWLDILKTMRQANMAHGDLAAVNVMVRPDGRLVLIDYDGVYIPDFAGLPQVLLGQEHYQHTQMYQRKFDEHMDDFSALVIYVALIALAAQPELWDKYAKSDAQGNLLDNNLLFTKEDFKEPSRSALLQELERTNEQCVRNASQELKQLCLLPIDQVRFPVRLINPNYHKQLALERLDEAVQNNDDELIVASWLSVLDSYPPAQNRRKHVQEAQQRVAALQTFRKAIQMNSIQQIITNYDTILDNCKNVTQEERELLALLNHFVQAYKAGDDDALLQIADTLQNSVSFKSIIFTAPQQQRLALVRQCKLALQQLRAALNSGNIEDIATTYDPVRYPYKGLSSKERQQAELADSFIQAHISDKDMAIIAAYEMVQDSIHHNSLLFTQQQRQRALFAQKRVAALARFRAALRSRNPHSIANAYDPVLDTSKDMTTEERSQCLLASNFSRAYDIENALELVAAYVAIQSSSYLNFFIFSAEVLGRVKQAKQHNQALATFRNALRDGYPHQIVVAYDPILDTSKSVTHEERKLFELANNFLRGYAADDDKTLVAVMNALLDRNAFVFTAQERQRIALAKRRLAALDTLQRAFRVQHKDARGLLAAYDASLLDASKDVTKEQRAHIAAAHSYLEMQRQVQAAIRVDNDEAIINAYNKALDQEFDGFSDAERRSINRIIKSLELKELLHNKEDERALRMAMELIKTSDKEVRNNLLPLHRATKRFIRQYDLTDLEVYIEEDISTGMHKAVIHWHWPFNDLVKEGVIAWSSDTWPQHPERAWREPDWQCRHVHRKNNRIEDEDRISIGQQRHIYVQAYACICDDWDPENRDPEHILWYYSSGFDPTSRQEAGSQRLIWRNYG